jgi:hypothetical protein
VSIPKHQAVALPRYYPKVSYVQVRTGDTTQVWKASGVFLDFQLPKAIGILNETRLRFSVLQSSATNIAPTPFWIQQIEVSIGTQIIETLYPADIFSETVGFLDSNEFLSKQDALALYSARDPAGAYTFTGTSRDFYLPFNNCLTAARLFVQGVSDDITFRVYFPPGMFNTANFSMSSVILEVVEDVPVDASETLALRKAHQQGMVYNTVVRQRQQTSITKSDNNSDLTIDLTGITGNSAGLVIYADTAVLPGTGTVADPTTASGTIAANIQIARRFPFNTVELDDQMGNKRTEELRGVALRAIDWWEQTETYFASDPNYSTHLLAFASHFKDAVETGCNFGAMNFDGTDRLVINAPYAYTARPSGTESWVVSITNYCYNQLVFKDSRLSVVSKR